MTIYLSKNIQGSKVLQSDILFINERESIRYIKFKRVKSIGILNLMPNKVETEMHLLKLLRDSKKDIDIKFIRLKTHQSKYTNNDYLKENYYTFDEIKSILDGIIITGAPIEKLEFSEVEYIDELKEILNYSKENFRSSLCICWGAQAALNHFYGVRKLVHDEKIFGIYEHEILNEDNILKGINEGFKSPHSRYTSLIKEDLEKCKDIKVLCTTRESNEHIVKGKFNDYYIFGHCEYDKDTLKNEYIRDINSNLDIKIPKNYFVDNDPNKDIILNWRDTSIKLYKNWLEGIKSTVS